MKKLALCLLVMLLACLSVSAFAAQDGDWYYDVENGGAVIVSYSFDSDSPETNLNIPKKLGGYPVTGIGYNAFEGCWWLKKVKLPSTIKEIGWYAFSGCYELEEVKLPYGLESIGQYAFAYCNSLRELKLPDSLTSISGSAFDSCGVTKLEIPAGVDRISSYTFAGCNNLKELTFKGKNTYVYTHAFHDEYFMSIPGMDAIAVPDNCVVTCWMGSSAEEIALKRGFTVKYFDVEKKPIASAPSTPSAPSAPSNAPIELPPPQSVPVVNSYNEFKKLPQESNKSEDEPDLPIFMQTEAEKEASIVTDKDGNPYTDSYIIRRSVRDFKDGTVYIDITAYGSDNETPLKWKGKANILFTYDDLAYFLGVSRDQISSVRFKIRHYFTDDTKGDFEDLTTDDGSAIYEKDGIRFPISSLSPFGFSTELDTAGSSSLPSTGDDSQPLALLFALLAASACGLLILKRRSA